MLFPDGLVGHRSEDRDGSLDRPAGAGVEDVVDSVPARLDARYAEDDVAVLAAQLHERTEHTERTVR